MTVTVCGPVLSSVASAAVMDVKTPGGGATAVQLTLTLAAQALAGWRHSTKAAHTAARRSKRRADETSLFFILFSPCS
jgi:hypothetical protein